MAGTSRSMFENTMDEASRDNSRALAERATAALSPEIGAKEESIRWLESENRRRILELTRAETELAQLKGSVTFRLLESDLV